MAASKETQDFARTASDAIGARAMWLKQQAITAGARTDLSLESRYSDDANTTASIADSLLVAAGLNAEWLARITSMR